MPAAPLFAFRRLAPLTAFGLVMAAACAGPSAGAAPRISSYGAPAGRDPVVERRSLALEADDDGGRPAAELGVEAAIGSARAAGAPPVAPETSAGSPAPPPASLASTPAAASPLAATVRPDLESGMVLTGASAHRMILFTFDDGPHPWHTRRLLEHLARADVHGVFFVNAHRFDRTSGWYADCALVLGEIAAAGHVIGSHGRDHQLTAGLHGAALDEQVVGAEDIFLRVLGARPWLFRPPGGVRSDATDAYLSARGYTQVLWTLHTGDYATRDSDEVVRNFRASVVAREYTSTPGGIAVIHDTHPWGVAAFPRMMRFLQRRNCDLLERGEELYEIVDDPSLFFTPRAAGTSASDVAPVVRLAPDALAERQARLRERERARCGAAAD